MAVNHSITAVRAGSLSLGKKIAPTEVFRRALLHKPCESVSSTLSHSPQLVVLFTWIGAKEKTAHKFVDAWNNRGFNVLHITSTVRDLVRPMSGTEVTAMKTAEFLTKYDKYNIIIHGLSVGGYLGQKVLLRLHEANEKPKITHQIYDSFTQISGFESGVENAVSPKFRSLVRAGVKLYTKMVDLSCLYETDNYIMTVPTVCPAFFMHSLSDKVARYEAIQKMMPNMARGSPVSAFVLPRSDKIPHVTLFRHMGEQPYMSLITRFLAKNNFCPLKRTVLLEEDPSSESAIVNESRVSQIEPLKEDI